MAKSSFTGDTLHFGVIRERVTGSGVLRQSLVSLSDVNSVAIPNIQMSSLTNKQPTVLANVNEQRAYLHGFTQDMDEVFNISKIIIYITPVATGLPTEAAPV